MTGPAEAGGGQEGSFRQLVESLRFESDQSPPRWTLPASWKENAGTGQRLATLSVDVDGQKSRCRSSNWPLRQPAIPCWTMSIVGTAMQLPPLTADQLPTESTTVNLPGGPATLVNLLGTMRVAAWAAAASDVAKPQPPERPPGKCPK